MRSNTMEPAEGLLRASGSRPGSIYGAAKRATVGIATALSLILQSVSLLPLRAETAKPTGGTERVASLKIAAAPAKSTSKAAGKRKKKKRPGVTAKKEFVSADKLEPVVGDEAKTRSEATARGNQALDSRPVGKVPSSDAITSGTTSAAPSATESITSASVEQPFTSRASQTAASNAVASDNRAASAPSAGQSTRASQFEPDTALIGVLKDLSLELEAASENSGVRNENEREIVELAGEILKTALKKQAPGVNRILKPEHSREAKRSMTTEAWTSGEVLISNDFTGSVAAVWGKKVDGLLNVTIAGQHKSKKLKSGDDVGEFIVVVTGHSPVRSGFDVQSHADVEYWIGKLANVSVDAACCGKQADAENDDDDDDDSRKTESKSTSDGESVKKKSVVLGTVLTERERKFRLGTGYGFNTAVAQSLSGNQPVPAGSPNRDEFSSPEAVDGESKNSVIAVASAISENSSRTDAVESARAENNEKEPSKVDADEEPDSKLQSKKEKKGSEANKKAASEERGRDKKVEQEARKKEKETEKERKQQEKEAVKEQERKQKAQEEAVDEKRKEEEDKADAARERAKKVEEEARKREKEKEKERKQQAKEASKEQERKQKAQEEAAEKKEKEDDERAEEAREREQKLEEEARKQEKEKKKQEKAAADTDKKKKGSDKDKKAAEDARKQEKRLEKEAREEQKEKQKEAKGDKKNSKDKVVDENKDKKNKEDKEAADHSKKRDKDVASEKEKQKRAKDDSKDKNKKAQEDEKRRLESERKAEEAERRRRERERKAQEEETERQEKQQRAKQDVAQRKAEEQKSREAELQRREQEKKAREEARQKEDDKKAEDAKPRDKDKNVTAQDSSKKKEDATPKLREAEGWTTGSPSAQIGTGGDDTPRLRDIGYKEEKTKQEKDAEFREYLASEQPDVQGPEVREESEQPGNWLKSMKTKFAAARKGSTRGDDSEPKLELRGYTESAAPEAPRERKGKKKGKGEKVAAVVDPVPAEKAPFVNTDDWRTQASRNPAAVTRSTTSTGKSGASSGSPLVASLPAASPGKPAMNFPPIKTPVDSTALSKVSLAPATVSSRSWESPATHVESRKPSLEASLHVPSRAMAGQFLTVAVLSKNGQPEHSVELSFNGATLSTNSVGQAMFMVPDDATPGRSLQISLAGRPELHPNIVEVLQPLVESQAGQPPRIEAVSKLVANDRVLQIDGHEFLGAAEKNSVVIDAGEAAHVISASPVQLRVVLPEKLAPGSHDVTITVDGKLSNSSRFDYVKAEIVPEERKSGLNKLIVKVTGTSKPVHVRVINHTPDVIKISKGDILSVTTSGGANNIVELGVKQIKRGDYKIDASVEL